MATDEVGERRVVGLRVQHEDGLSLVNASTVPYCVGFEPTYAYELSVIIQDGLRRMMGEQEIVKDLFLKLEYFESRDTKPPSGAEATSDRGVVFSLEWRGQCVGTESFCTQEIVNFDIA